MALHIQVKSNNPYKLYKIELTSLPINSVIHPKIYALSPHYQCNCKTNKNEKFGKTWGKFRNIFQIVL